MIKQMWKGRIWNCIKNNELVWNAAKYLPALENKLVTNVIVINEWSGNILKINTLK